MGTKENRPPEGHHIKAPRPGDPGAPPMAFPVPPSMEPVVERAQREGIPILQAARMNLVATLQAVIDRDREAVEEAMDAWLESDPGNSQPAPEATADRHLAESDRLNPIKLYPQDERGSGGLINSAGYRTTRTLRYGVGQQHADGSISILLRSAPIGGRMRLVPGDREGAFDIVGPCTFSFADCGVSMVDKEGKDVIMDYFKGYLEGKELPPFREPEGDLR